MEGFSLPPHAGLGDATKGASPSLGRGADPLFSLSYCVGTTLKCCECLLATASFQCIGGGSVPPPTACRTLGRAMRRKARRLALADAPSIYFSFVLCSQNVKICACLLAMPSFQCVGGGTLPPPMACWTQGRAARPMAPRLASADVPSLYFSFVLCSQNVKICACLFPMPSFQCVGGGNVWPPMACRTLGRAAHPMAPRLALADAPSLYFSFVLCSQNVNICACLFPMPSFQCIQGGSLPPPMPCRTLGRATRPMVRCLALRLASM